MKDKTSKEIIKDDIGNYAALEALKKSEGGMFLLELLSKDILSCIDSITLKYKDISHAELISLSAKLAEKLSIFRAINRSSKNKKLASEALKNLLEED